MTDAYGARARAGCTWLGSLRLKITSIPISILYSSAVPLGSSRKTSLCVFKRGRRGNGERERGLASLSAHRLRVALSWLVSRNSSRLSYTVMNTARERAEREDD